MEDVRQTQCCIEEGGVGVSDPCVVLEGKGLLESLEGGREGEREGGREGGRVREEGSHMLATVSQYKLASISCDSYSNFP